MACEAFKETETYAEDKRYWLEKVADFPSAPTLPLKEKAERIERPHFRRLSKVYVKEAWEGLKQKAQAQRVTASGLLCAAYAEVLSFWSNQSRLSLNLTVFNRHPFHEDVNRVIGDFTSVMLLDIDFEGRRGFWERAKG